MAPCSRCRLDPEATPRIPDDIAEICLKTRDSPCLACQKLLRIEGKIEETRRSLEQLLAEREELASALNEHHDPFLNQLPVELVSHIFTLSRPYQPSLGVFNFDIFDEHTNNRGALNPGQVCRNWRYIAHHTSELWTVFAITILPKNNETLLEVSLDWLERSGGLPLFVQLSANKRANNDEPPIHQFLASIALHAHRWKVLELLFPIAMFRTFSSALAGKGLDQLEHLSLDARDVTFGEPRVLELKAAPACLSVENGSLDRFCIDWSRLTQFVGNHDSKFTIPDCVHLFTNAPNLILCRMDVVLAFGAELVVQNVPVEHCSLQTLQLGVCAPLFWDHFNFPGLTTIQLDQGNHHLSWNPFRACLRRSQCKIIDVSFVDNYYSTVHEILEILVFLCHVERLTIEGFDFAGRLLSLMTIHLFTQLNSGPLPQLKALNFHPLNKEVSGFNWSALMAFLAARKSSGQQSLESIELHFDGRPPLIHQDMIVDRAELRQMLGIAGGLELRLVDDKGSDFLKSLRCHYGL